MNERIIKLARQAANGMLSFNAEGDWRLNEKEVEKFAELIVRECAEFARQHNLEKADRSHLIHRAIKQHFGVEQ